MKQRQDVKQNQYEDQFKSRGEINAEKCRNIYEEDLECGVVISASSKVNNISFYKFYRLAKNITDKSN